jgi:hypothetical protein
MATTNTTQTITTTLTFDDAAHNDIQVEFDIDRTEYAQKDMTNGVHTGWLVSERKAEDLLAHKMDIECHAALVDAGYEPVESYTFGALAGTASNEMEAPSDVLEQLDLLDVEATAYLAGTNVTYGARVTV